MRVFANYKSKVHIDKYYATMAVVNVKFYPPVRLGLMFYVLLLLYLNAYMKNLVVA